MSNNPQDLQQRLERADLLERVVAAEDKVKSLEDANAEQEKLLRAAETEVQHLTKAREQHLRDEQDQKARLCRERQELTRLRQKYIEVKKRYDLLEYSTEELRTLKKVLRAAHVGVARMANKGKPNTDNEPYQLPGCVLGF